MDYLLKSSLLVVILVGFYYLFLKNETFFNSIRSYFIAGLLIATLLPLIEIPIYVEAVARDLSQFELVASNSEVIATPSFDWIKLLVGIYLVGVLVLFTKLLLQFSSLFLFFRKNHIQKDGKFYFVKTGNNISPFSFFNTIVFNPNHFTPEELQLVVQHEKAHARQLHSIDTILTQLLVVFLWFNPFAWLLKKAVQQNLEFLADAHVSTNSENDKLYKLTLLKTCTNHMCTDISNNFYNSIIKNRIIMLQKNPSKKSNQLKYALLLPILILFLFVFNTKTIAQEKEHAKKEHNEFHFEMANVELIIDKNTTDATLSGETKTFEEEFGVKLSFKGVKRNGEGEITSIKIAAKNDKSSTSYNTSGDEPIKPIKISYSSEGSSLSISSLSEVHEKHFSYKFKDEDGNISIKSGDGKKGNYVFIKEDGEKVSWTIDGEGKNNKDGNVLIVESDDNVWVEKDGDKKIIIKEIHKGDGEEHNIIVKEIEKGGKGKNVVVEIKTDGEEDENVFFISKDGEEVKKVKKKGNMMFISDSGDQPLYIIDGKESTEKEMKDLDKNKIETMNVLKGESAEKKYGKKAKNGVIEIITKKS